MINWKEGNNWVFTGTSGIHGDYGWFHVYAFTMTLGMILAILYSFYKFRKRDLSFDSLIWGVLFIVPASLFGASFFGKFNAEGAGINAGNVGFWGLWAFWRGGMSIHGGVYAGLLVGLIVFGIIGRKNHVSIWTYIDAIVPNILLGQVVGRWGNFFNHELVGAPIRYLGHTSNTAINQWGFIDFNQLGLNDPWSHSIFGWIWKNTSAVYTGSQPTTINGITVSYGDVCQMSPIFLIESFSLLAVWLLVTFVIPNIGKWFGPKPWKIEASKYPLSWKIYFINLFKPWKHVDAKTPSAIWEEAFVENKDLEAISEYQRKMQTLTKNNISARWARGNALIDANNPQGYWITKVGCEGSAYFFGWNFVRFILELSRPDDHLFIMYDKPLSLALIAGSAIIGLIGMVLTQIGLPQFTRREGWVYEKPYFILDKTATPKIEVTDSPINENKALTKSEKAWIKMQKRETK